MTQSAPETQNYPLPRSREDGFTLTEVLVTMAIIGLLTTGVVLAVLPRLGDASITKAAFPGAITLRDTEV